MELINDDRLNDALEVGAKKWKEQYSSGSEIVNEVGLRQGGRSRRTESCIVTPRPAPEDSAVEDFLWAVMLLPEFQLIY